MYHRRNCMRPPPNQTSMLVVITMLMLRSSQASAFSQVRSLATSFSGMNTAARAIFELGRTFHTRSIDLRVHLVSTCDIDSHAQHILIHGCSQGCVFGDVSKSLEHTAIGGPKLSLLRPCLRHGGQCNTSRADFAINGFPCTDFSPQGKRAGLEGRTIAVIKDRHCFSIAAFVVFFRDSECELSGPLGTTSFSQACNKLVSRPTC